MSVWVVAAPAVPPTTAGGTTGIQIATLIVASFDVLATLVAAYLLRRTGKGLIAKEGVFGV